MARLATSLATPTSMAFHIGLIITAILTLRFLSLMGLEHLLRSDGQPSPDDSDHFKWGASCPAGRASTGGSQVTVR